MFRFPIWPYMKLVLCVWLVLPMFNGAAYIYENYVRQYVKHIGTYGGFNKYPEEQKKVLQMISFDARKSVERYIDRYGPDAFERVIRVVYYYKQRQLDFLTFFITFLFTFFEKHYLCLYYIFDLQAEKEARKH